MLLNLLLSAVAIVALPVAGYELTYDFATGEDLNDWDIHYNGVTTTSTAIASGTELTLSPTQSTVSAVDIQLEGNFYRVDVWAQMSGTAALSRYFDISIGNGSLTDNG